MRSASSRSAYVKMSARQARVDRYAGTNHALRRVVCSPLQLELHHDRGDPPKNPRRQTFSPVAALAACRVSFIVAACVAHVVKVPSGKSVIR